MKNHFIVTLLIVLMSGTIATAQTKKPTTPTKKPTTTVKSNVPKTTTTKKTTTTTTTTTPVAVPPPVVEEKKTTTTTTTTETPTEKKSTTTPSTTTTTTTTQSSGPSKGKKTSEPRVKEPKPERVREPRPERVREPRPERVRTPKVSSGSSGGVKLGIRLEASQAISFESGLSYDISPGVNAGLFANIPFSEKISIQPEVLYSMQVGKIDPAKNTTNSILAPVTFNFNLGSGTTKFIISPGGYANYYLSESNTTNGVSVETDLTGVDKFYYGTVLGLGIKINSKLLIETRAFYDLKRKDNKSIFATFGIGYMF